MCARTRRLVPSGPDGHGYHLTKLRNWVKGALGVIRVMVELTSVVLGVGAAAGLVSNLVEAVGKAGEIAKNEDFLGLREQYATALANDENGRAIERTKACNPGDVVSMQASGSGLAS